MNNKLFDEIKLKMVMKVHGLSRAEAEEKISDVPPVRSSFNVNRDDDEEIMMTAEEFFGID
jgi:hypothetical protein